MRKREGLILDFSNYALGPFTVVSLALNSTQCVRELGFVTSCQRIQCWFSKDRSLLHLGHH